MALGEFSVDRARGTMLTAAGAAVLIFFLLLPYTGNDSDPPECFSVFEYVVPCGLGPEQEQGIDFALAGAVLAAVAVGAGSLVGRREAAAAGSRTWAS